jgi:aspartate kinase
MKTLVMKFGGTSVGSVDALRQAAAIVCEHSHQWEGLVVVVSAMSGVTDMLLKCASAAVKGNEDVYALTIDQLRVKHRDVVDALVPEPQENAGLKSKIDLVASELGAISRSVHVLGEITPRGLDAISSQGERLNAALFSALLREMGCKSKAVDATRLIQTNSQFQNAHPNMQVTRKLTRAELLPLLEDGCVPVVTGFLAANEEGVVTTLVRGGSD